jgi:hypothetical protein
MWADFRARILADTLIPLASISLILCGYLARIEDIQQFLELIFKATRGSHGLSAVTVVKASFLLLLGPSVALESAINCNQHHYLNQFH